MRSIQITGRPSQFRISGRHSNSRKHADVCSRKDEWKCWKSESKTGGTKGKECKNHFLVLYLGEMGLRVRNHHFFLTHQESHVCEIVETTEPLMPVDFIDVDLVNEVDLVPSGNGVIINDPWDAPELEVDDGQVAWKGGYSVKSISTVDYIHSSPSEYNFFVRIRQSLFVRINCSDELSVVNCSTRTNQSRLATPVVLNIGSNVPKYYVVLFSC